MGFNLKKTLRKALGKTGSKIVGTVADTLTGGTASKLLNGDSYINDAVKKVTGQDSFDVATSVALNALTKGLAGSGNSIESTLGQLLGGTSTGGVANTITDLLGLSGVDWGNSVFSAKQAKEQAKYNSELNYKYQTKLNEQGYAHDKEMLGIQQAYDREMANTAVQRQMADLQAAGVNPAMASQLGGAGGGGLGGGSSLGGGSAQTDKANWLAYNLEKMAGQRDAQRVAIEQANSAKSAEVADKQIEKINTDMAKTIAEIPWIGKTNQANIKYTLAQAGKAHSETALAQANTDKVKQGVLATLAGTNASGKAKAILGAGAAFLPGIGIGAKLYKGAKTAKGFSNFLKTIK